MCSHALQSAVIGVLVPSLLAWNPLAPNRVGNGWGTNIHWTSAQPGEAAELASAFKVVRMDLNWAAVEPAAGKYDFSQFDVLLSEMAAVDVAVYLILDYFNPTIYGAMPPFNESQAQAFGNYAFAAVDHFRQNGYANLVIECQNEPNGGCT
jgi:hypothetical protein